MKKIIIAICIATTLAVAATPVFALTDTPNCSGATKTNWAKCIIEDSQKGHDG